MLNVAYAIALLARREGIRIDSVALAEADKQGQFDDIDQLTGFYRQYGLRLQTKKIDKSFALDNRTVPCVIFPDGKGPVCLLSPAEPSPDGLVLSYIDPENPGALNKMALDELKAAKNKKVIIFEGIKDSDRISCFDRAEFIRTFTRRPAALALLVALSMTVAILSLTPIIYLQVALDKVIGYGATSTFSVLTVFTVLAVAAAFILGRFRDEILNFFGAELDMRLNLAATEKALAASQKGLVEPGVALSVQGAIDKLRKILINTLAKNVLDLSYAVLIAPILFLYSPALAILVVIYCALALAVSATAARRSKDAWQDLDNALQTRSATARAIMTARNMLLSFDMDIRQSRDWLHKTGEASACRSKVASMETSSASRSVLFQSGLTVMIIFAGVHLVLAGMLTPGSLIALNLLASRMLQPILKLGYLASESRAIKEACEKVNTVLSLPYKASLSGLKTPVSGQVKLDQVVLQGKDGVFLKNINLQIGSGGRVALLSNEDLSAFALASALDGSLKPEAGTILFDETDILKMDKRWLAKRVMRLDSSPRFFGGTIAGNLHGLHPDVDPRDIDSIVASLGLADNLAKLPEGLETEIQTDGAPLNYNSKTQLALARALVAMPSVLIIDGAFDPMPLEVAANLLRAVKARIGGGTLVVATVRADIAELLEERYAISAGKLEKMNGDKKIVRAL